MEMKASYLLQQSSVAIYDRMGIAELPKGELFRELLKKNQPRIAGRMANR